jgi:sucrose phosphorylase
VDYDFTNPEVLECFLNVILDFINHGFSVLSLDAVGFLCKRSGTTKARQLLLLLSLRTHLH